ncbi:hypothetical protein CUMW_238980 [Citrus unshiu]|uniref:R13L1/DRL21-like LRR repeat region domain-containing protein n=1 Tax=Citrus unshiu TaxID=55188 RepID=A0A2H5QKK4_CITUN|nr:hypothetical protein CUMW_238980 [Citrus unshiu]
MILPVGLLEKYALAWRIRRMETINGDFTEIFVIYLILVGDLTESKEMPLRIGKLTSLRTLTKFAVGKSNCSGLSELRSSTLLHEKLTILGLENVNVAEDAKEVAEIQTRVLEMLKPHYGLKELKVQNYGGTKFPAWLGQSSFENLVVLRFRNCNQCTSLPSVGHLPLLKNLVIKGMGRMAKAGTTGGDQQAAKGFPCLRELSIINCSKLKGRLPQHFSSLKRIVIMSCEQLLVSCTTLPLLCELEIDGFGEVAWINRPVEAGIFDSSNPGPEKSRTEVLPWEIGSPDQESLPEGLHKLSHITRISIVGSYLVSFPKGGLESLSFVRNLTSLERLELSRCPILKSFPENGLLPSAVYLSIYLCPDLEEKCKKDEREYCHLVADIPFVQLNHKLVFDPREFS